MTQIIKGYDTLVDKNGLGIVGRYILTIELKHIDSEGNFTGEAVGTVSVANSPAITFIIDENIFNQLDNLQVKIIDNKFELVAKEGYEFKTVEEQETPEQKKIRELKEQLAALEASQKQGE